MDHDQEAAQRIPAQGYVARFFACVRVSIVSAIGSRSACPVCAKLTPCFLRFDAALAESNSIGMARVCISYAYHSRRIPATWLKGAGPLQVRDQTDDIVEPPAEQVFRPPIWARKINLYGRSHIPYRQAVCTRFRASSSS